MSTDYCWDTVHIMRWLDAQGVLGNVVECGVFKGGQAMLAKEVSQMPRRYWLYDTFCGMPMPGLHDVSSGGANGMDKWRDRQRIDGHWCACSLDEVRDNFSRLGLLGDDIIFVEGRVEETLRVGSLPDRIAFLRLDTDFYDSTRVELEVLWPQVVPGGVLMVDDYYAWNGARKATDDFLRTAEYEPAEIPSGAFVVTKGKRT